MQNNQVRHGSWISWSCRPWRVKAVTYSDGIKVTLEGREYTLIHIADLQPIEMTEQICEQIGLAYKMGEYTTEGAWKFCYDIRKKIFNAWKVKQGQVVERVMKRTECLHIIQSILLDCGIYEFEKNIAL